MNETISTDQEYLLRCALTYNWDALVEGCSLLVDIFQGRNFEEIKKGRRQLLARDQWGNTVLHTACFNKPPVDAVQALLTASNVAQPEAVALHSMRTSDGSTALQIACACGASVDVVKSLLHTGSRMQPAGGTIVSSADHAGATPLTDLTVQYTLERKSPQHRGSLPLDQIESVEDAERSEIFYSFYQKLRALLQANWRTHHKAREPSLLHAAARIADTCPPVLIDFLCKCAANGVAVLDHEGKLPLHYAIRSAERRNSEDDNDCVVRKHMERREYFILKLLKIYPQAVFETADSFFSLAIMEGFHWHHSCGRGEGPLAVLYRLRPSYVEINDDGLFPVFQAATTQLNVANEQTHLSTIYNILRSYPQALGSRKNGV